VRSVPKHVHACKISLLCIVSAMRRRFELMS
jgi:hypothetical protein